MQLGFAIKHPPNLLICAYGGKLLQYMLKPLLETQKCPSGGLFRARQFLVTSAVGSHFLHV